MIRFSLGTTLALVTAIAISVGWWADANRRTQMYYLHVYLLLDPDQGTLASTYTAQISLNRPFSFWAVFPDAPGITGKLESSLGNRLELEFTANGCSFSGPVKLDRIHRAEVDGVTIDHVFIVTSEADPKIAAESAGSGG